MKLKLTPLVKSEHPLESPDQCSIGFPTALNHGCRAAIHTSPRLRRTGGGQVSLYTLIGWPLATYSVPVPPRLEFNTL